MTHLVRALSDEKETVVFFTGAGMSTESGLPDFRSAERGLWGAIDPMEVASIEALNERAESFFQFYQMRIEAATAVEPNEGHAVLSRWQRSGSCDAIITQNVDGFHTIARCPTVHELHGTLHTVRCSRCDTVYPNTTFAEANFQCEACGHALRPNVVLFGERLPETPYLRSVEAAERATTFVVLGSSLTVSPANDLPRLAKTTGAYLIIVNYDETPLDAIADEVIRDESITDYLCRVDRSWRDEK